VRDDEKPPPRLRWLIQLDSGTAGIVVAVGYTVLGLVVVPTLDNLFSWRAIRLPHGWEAVMRYAIALLCALSCVAYTQDLTTNLNAAAGTLEQVLYVADGTNLYTYDIDPQTFQPSLMGTIPLPKTQVNGLAASSDGRFLYVMASDPYPATDNRIYVFDTTGYGVPGMPLQSVRATNASSMFLDPADNFLYAVHMGMHATQNQTLPWSIYRYEVNATNGELTHLVDEATYLLPNQGTNFCSLSIAGMNPRGTEIYDYEFCGTHEGANGFYHERTVNPQTGAMGAPDRIFAWGVDTDGNPDSVQIIKGLLFAFSYPVAYQPFNGLQVYHVTANRNAKPLIDCAWNLSAVCASDIGVAHPSAKYVFYLNAQDNTIEVDAVDLSSKQIVRSHESGTISIFGFNASTAAITTGGSVTQSSAISIFPAERR
jgi:hypothetical protein